MNFSDFFKNSTHRKTVKTFSCPDWINKDHIIGSKLLLKPTTNQRGNKTVLALFRVEHHQRKAFRLKEITEKTFFYEANILDLSWKSDSEGNENSLTVKIDLGSIINSNLFDSKVQCIEFLETTKFALIANNQVLIVSKDSFSAPKAVRAQYAGVPPQFSSIKAHKSKFFFSVSETQNQAEGGPEGQSLPTLFCLRRSVLNELLITGLEAQRQAVELREGTAPQPPHNSGFGGVADPEDGDVTFEEELWNGMDKEETNNLKEDLMQL